MAVKCAVSPKCSMIGTAKCVGFEVTTKKDPHGTKPTDVLYVTKVRTHPRSQALDLLGRWLGMFAPKQHGDTDGILEPDNLTDEELTHQQRDLNDQLFKLKFQLNMGQTESLKKIRGMRRDIARVKTIARERELAASGKTGSK